MYKLGWFSTGRDKAARDLLAVAKKSIEQGEIKADIDFIFSNRSPGESAESDLFLKLAESYGIPRVHFSSKDYKTSAPKLSNEWRLSYDREVMKRISDLHPDLCVLAGYMLIVGSVMCRKYNMINLHPAAPGGPKGTWQEVIWQLIESRAKETGVMMHLVTPELDEGPPVTYCTFSIRGKPFDKYWQEIANKAVEEIKKTQGEDNPLFKLIREYGLAREFPLIIATLKAFSQSKVKISPNKQVVDAEEKPIKGYNLSGEINQMAKITSS